MGEQPEFNIAEAWAAIAEAEKQLESDIPYRAELGTAVAEFAPTSQMANRARKRYGPCARCSPGHRASSCTRRMARGSDLTATARPCVLARSLPPLRCR